MPKRVTGLIREKKTNIKGKKKLRQRSPDVAVEIGTKSQKETERMQKRPDAGGFAGAGSSFLLSFIFIGQQRPEHIPKSYLFQVKGILNYTGGGHSHTKNVLFCGEVVWCRDSIYLH